MRKRAGENWITATELADTLVRTNGIPFRAAHEVAAKFIAWLDREPGASKAAVLATVSREVLGGAVEYSDDDLARLLSPEHFVAVRRTHGGPAPDETARAIASARLALDSDCRWLDERTAALEHAGRTLRARAGEL
jgi:argininosuccinate lyase